MGWAPEQALAQEQGAARPLVLLCETMLREQLDEKTRNLMFEWVVQQFGNESFTNTEYLRHLSHVVRTLAKFGKGVLVGRGAQFILSAASTLRIRTIAPLDKRIDRIAEREGVSRSKV